tara:strand:+ start:741 stop:998 length:258 start_codon:yes stop_codon:yes gene_type:complete
MKTESYKTIKFNIDQLSTSIVAFEKCISEQKKDVIYFTEKLNGSSSTEDVRQYQKYIKNSKDRIKIFDDLIGQMAHNELITRHEL